MLVCILTSIYSPSILCEFCEENKTWRRRLKAIVPEFCWLALVLRCLQSLVCISVDIAFNWDVLYVFLMRYRILGPGIIKYFFTFLFECLRVAMLLLNVFAINRLIHIIAQIVWRICHQQKPKLKKTGELSLVSRKKISLLPFSTLFYTIFLIVFISYSSYIRYIYCCFPNSKPIPFMLWNPDSSLWCCLRNKLLISPQWLYTGWVSVNLNLIPGSFWGTTAAHLNKIMFNLVFPSSCQNIQNS